MIPPLACTVRGCGLLLERRHRTYLCARRHSYDMARSGYINLLQPQDRRSRSAGDTREAVDARVRLQSAGVGRALIDLVVERAVDGLGDDAVVVDLGAGTGLVLAATAARYPVTAIGIDLSRAAAEHAARTYPELTWVVANADRRLPLLDRSVDVVVSVHGRRNPAECARVLAAGGRLIVALPAADDLVELRTHVQGRAVERDRVDSLAAEHDASFQVVTREVVRERARLDGDRLRDLLEGTYRSGRLSRAERRGTLESLDVTLASDVIVFAPRHERP